MAKADSQSDWKSCGAGGRTRTDMSVTSPDFESGAYTNFATPAFGDDNNRASSDSSATFTPLGVACL